MQLPAVFAHVLREQRDLPLPMWMVVYGGVMVLLVSFSALIVLWRKPRWDGDEPGAVLLDCPSSPLRAITGLARFAGLATLGLVVIAALVGENDPSVNIAPVTVYIVVWVGFSLVTGLVGDVWRLVNPFDTLTSLVLAIRRGRRATRAAPDLGYWPAAAGLFGFAWLELVYPDADMPRLLGVIIVAYTAVVVTAASVWGRNWLLRGEAFTAFFHILGHAAPLGRGGDGRLRLRPPFAGLASLRPERGLHAVVLVVLGSTVYDGISTTGYWAEFSGRYRGWATTLVATGGLIWSIFVVFVIYEQAMILTARLAGGDPTRLIAAFVPSLVPIAFGYSMAHYFSLLVHEGQDVVRLVSDPLGWGWDTFGTAGHTTDDALLGSGALAWVQLAAIVGGHVAAVVVAHDRSLITFRPGQVNRGQYPLLAAMVTFTVGGLLLLLGH
jgi:hypothetical protein